MASIPCCLLLPPVDAPVGLHLLSCLLCVFSFGFAFLFLSWFSQLVFSPVGSHFEKRARYIDCLQDVFVIPQRGALGGNMVTGEAGLLDIGRRVPAPSKGSALKGYGIWLGTGRHCTGRWGSEPFLPSGVCWDLCQRPLLAIRAKPNPSSLCCTLPLYSGQGQIRNGFGLP